MEMHLLSISFCRISSNHMSTHMVNLLVRNPSVVLQDVVVLDALRNRDPLRHGQDLGKLVIGDVVELRAVVLGNDELHG
jgi:hypothetical protein